MLTLLDNGGTYQLPTGWHEVSTKQFCEIDAANFRTHEQRASYFADRPIQVNGFVADVLAWILHRARVPLFDLAQAPYLCFEELQKSATLPEFMGNFVSGRNHVVHGKPYTQKGAAAVARCYADTPTLETHEAFLFCQNEALRLLDPVKGLFRELAEPDTTEAGRRAREAGANELLGPFGHYNIASAYAERKHLTLEAAYDTPWQTVATWLIHERRSAILADTIQRNAQRAND